MGNYMLLSVFFDLLKGQKRPVRDWQIFQLESVVFAIAVAVVALIIIWLISDRIPYQRGNSPKDALLRRIMFFVVGAVSVAILFYAQFFIVEPHILQSNVNKTYQVFISSLAIEAATYFVIGYLLSKIFKFYKFGTIFPAIKKK